MDVVCFPWGLVAHLKADYRGRGLLLTFLVHTLRTTRFLLHFICSFPVILEALQYYRILWIIKTGDATVIPLYANSIGRQEAIGTIIVVTRDAQVCETLPEEQLEGFPTLANPSSKLRLVQFAKRDTDRFLVVFRSPKTLYPRSSNAG